METARAPFPSLRPSPCGRVCVYAGRFGGPVQSSSGGGEHISHMKLSKNSRSARLINPIFTNSSSIGLSYGRSEGQMLSSSGIRESSTVGHLMPYVYTPTEKSDFRFDGLQPSDQDLSPTLRRDFSRFTARVALIDLELWAAAWLRAETNYENLSDLRYMSRLKMQYAEQVKNDEKNGKRNAIQSVVGTLNVHVRHPLHGEFYPGERINKPGICDIYKTDQPQYGYISNVCVSKHARRQGIGRNMIALAIDISLSHGAKEVFIHVHKENYAAQNLYHQMGFKSSEVDCREKIQHLIFFIFVFFSVYASLAVYVCAVGSL